MHDPHFPIPFALDDLPEALRAAVRAAAGDGLEASDAKAAIEAHWEDGGARTPGTLLAVAYLGVKDACEIMVDDQLRMAEQALTLVEEARRGGARESEGLARFVALARTIRDEERARKGGLEAQFDVDPETLDQPTAADIAYELCDRGRDAEAVPFFTRVIGLVGPGRRLHYEMNRARCQLKAGDVEAARAFWVRVVREQPAADRFIVSDAWSGLLETEEDDERFAALFEEALGWARQQGESGAFPAAHPTQERLLERAMERDLGPIALHLCDVIEGRGGRLAKALEMRVAEARRRFG